MRPIARMRAATLESWFSLATVVIFCVLAAVATALTVQAYGPVFTAPANGP